MLSGFSLLSFEFLSLSVVGVIALGTLGGAARQLAFITLNVIFIWGILLGPVGALSTIAFCLLGYAAVRASVRWPTWGFRIGLATLVLLFIYMQNYDFLVWILPDDLLTSILRTVGLSFLFFKIIHVLVDAHGGALGSLEFLTYLNYCLNFSTFLMGPIQRYEDYHAQWYGEKRAIPLTVKAHLNAIIRILFGFVKSYVIADRLILLAMSPNSNLYGVELGSFLIRMYFFYFYLYFNFGGYCDIAIGIGCLLGIRPPENFNKPFLSKNVSEFWLRMHRSLTLWLTDYVFNPSFKWALSTRWLGSHPMISMSFALFLTMIVSGLWHGTTASFLVFGLLHGVYLVIQRIWEHLMSAKFGRKGARRLRERLDYRLASMVLTFNATAFAYVFFVLDWRDVVTMFRHMEFTI